MRIDGHGCSKCATLALEDSVLQWSTSCFKDTCKYSSLTSFTRRALKWEACKSKGFSRGHAALSSLAGFEFAKRWRLQSSSGHETRSRLCSRPLTSERTYLFTPPFSDLLYSYAGGRPRPLRRQFFRLRLPGMLVNKLKFRYKFRSSYTCTPRLSKTDASSIWSSGNPRCCFHPLEYGVQPRILQFALFQG
jgi:hypothetical protein